MDYEFISQFYYGNITPNVQNMPKDSDLGKAARAFSDAEEVLCTVLTDEEKRALFSGKIYCGECGQIYGSKVWHSNDPYRKVVWHCNDKFKNGRKCETPTITEDEIKAAFDRVLRKLTADKAEIIDNLRTALDCNEDPALRKQTETLTRERDAVAMEANEAISQNAKVAQDQDEYNERYAELVKEYDRLDSEIKRLERETEG